VGAVQDQGGDRDALASRNEVFLDPRVHLLDDLTVRLLVDGERPVELACELPRARQRPGPGTTAAPASWHLSSLANELIAAIAISSWFIASGILLFVWHLVKDTFFKLKILKGDPEIVRHPLYLST